MFDKKYELEVNKYGDVKGIPDGWIKIPEGDAELYDGKDIPIYRANEGFSKKRGRYIPNTVIITHEDYREEAQRIYEEERVKDENYASHSLSDKKLVVDALRVIDNEVKRQQELMDAAQDKAYGNGKKRSMSKTKDISAKRSYFEARNKKNKLYALKDKAIKRMIDEWGSNPSGCFPVNRSVKAIEAFVGKGSTAPSDINRAKRTKQHGGNGMSRESKGEWLF